MKEIVGGSRGRIRFRACDSVTNSSLCAIFVWFCLASFDDFDVSLNLEYSFDLCNVYVCQIVSNLRNLFNH